MAADLKKNMTLKIGFNLSSLSRSGSPEEHRAANLFVLTVSRLAQVLFT